MAEITRREVIKRGIGGGAAMSMLSVEGVLSAALQTAQPQPGRRPSGDATELRWLEAAPPAVAIGATWGVPWPRGACKADQPFSLETENGQPLPLQSWPLALWPDGSIKWSGHATTADATKSARLALSPKAGAPLKIKPVTVEERPDAFEIDTGVVRVTVARSGSSLIRSINRDGSEVAADARLVCSREDRSKSDDGVTRVEQFEGKIESATIEQNGPVRAVVKLTGKHVGHGREWLPFVVRLYFYAGSDAVRIMHSFIYDGDQMKDFIRSLGVRVSVPMRGEMHDRHVRFAGEEGGLWAEAVRVLSGQRRDPGRAVTEAQFAGRACPPTSEFAAAVRDRLHLIPAWGDVTLAQLTPDSFEIRKRTKSKDVTSIRSANGKRAPGLGYVGTPKGGLVFGYRDFWQRYPAQLDIRDAHTDRANVTMWMWSPDAPAMDVRPYHDGMGMDTFPEQIEGLNITYEDYEPGFDNPYGVARTSELMLWAVAATPMRDRYEDYAKALTAPPLLVCEPQRYVDANVFGGLFGVVDRSTPVKSRIEDALDWQFDYYTKQREAHHWYGFWDYGDVMHSYDPVRHMWRYDNGGMAWANSELSPDLWLWYAFLRSGRADVFRFAEAMTRHTGEVDVYHLGRWAGLGSRHNVLHWGCSAKQLRISTAVYRRMFYYLTADERVGDLMRELVDADKTFLTLDPIRKIRRGAYEPKPEALSVGFGTDWGSLAVAWLTEWERTGNTKVRDKLLAGVRTIGLMPNGFFTADATYNMHTGEFAPPADRRAVGLSHLSAVFGLLEICAELIDLFPQETAFRDAWLQYCTLYNAPREERTAAVGNLGGNSLTTPHSRLTAYAARMKKDPKLAARAWSEFDDDLRWSAQRYTGKTTPVAGPEVLNPLQEAAWIGTNDASQWGLAAIQNLHLIGDALPAEVPATRPAAR